MNNETKVGIFVFIIITVFFVLSIKIGEIDFTRKATYPITMSFASVEGLKVGAPLELAGVMVGSVRRITLRDDYSAAVETALNEDIRLPVDTMASIGSKGVLGDKIIVIAPGTSESMLAPGATLERTTTPPSLDTILTLLGEISHNLSQFTGSLNQVFGDEHNIARMKDMLENLYILSENASLMVRENREGLRDLITHLDGATGNIALAADNLAHASTGIDEIVGTVSSGRGNLGLLLKDEKLYTSLVGITTKLQMITSQMEEENNLSLLLSDSTLYHNMAAITENLKFVSEEIAAGRGSLGQILADDQLYLDLEDTLDNANRALDGIQEQTPISVMGTILGLIW